MSPEEDVEEVKELGLDEDDNLSRSEKCHKQFYLDRGERTEKKKKKRGCRLSFFLPVLWRLKVSLQV